jgi:hypothetical protein
VGKVRLPKNDTEAEGFGAKSCGFRWNQESSTMDALVGFASLFAKRGNIRTPSNVSDCINHSSTVAETKLG